jgi:hypothetical protein
MNEDLQKTIIEIIGKCDELSIKHAPNAVHDLLLWSRIEWAFYTLPVIICGIITWRCVVRVHKICIEHSDDYYNNLEVNFAVAAFVFGTITMIAGVLMCSCVLDAVHSTVAPYSFILEKVAACQ